jgi:phosphomannomutase
VSNLISQAQAWLDQDPDPVTKTELAALIQEGNLNELESRFGSRLQFGTAGLRGELGAGPNRMNRIVVAQAALAIARFLQANRETYRDKEDGLSVVIGFDGRVNSDIFASDSAAIFQAAGIRALLFDSPVPTPVACFTGHRLNSSATIVVTASHNPPRDNGYKVYLGGPIGGSQLVPPQDAEIANLIDQIAAGTRFDQIPMEPVAASLGEREVALYQARAAELITSVNHSRSSLSITYTAMHGVGYRVIKPIFEAAGFELSSVARQEQPDGSFPTVSFPNPEEPGAMDLALAHAAEHKSDLILANDPDADRLAVGIRTASGYRMLTGDEVGLILAHRAATTKGGTIANSIVSASLSSLAKALGVEYQQTLTGFKWISKVPGLSYGYEEALGYCVDPEATPDKDGITAALVIAELAADLKAAGRDLADLLSDLADEFGHLKTSQISIRVSDLSRITQIMAGARAKPMGELLGQTATTRDLMNSEPKTDALIIASETAQVIVRPSGTEPKLKCYLQASGSTAEAAEKALSDLRSAASDYLDSL